MQSAARAFQSSLAIGVLGLPVAEALQQGIHKLLGNTEPRGYSHQISDGGEPTFMYSVSRYRLLAQGSCLGHPYSLRLGAGASVGYLTEANLEIVARSDAPWWSSSTVSGDYAGHPAIGGPAPAAAGRPRLQLEAGARAARAAVQRVPRGPAAAQRRRCSAHELEPLLVDLWIGATTVFPKGFSVSYRSGTRPRRSRAAAARAASPGAASESPEPFEAPGRGAVTIEAWIAPPGAA